MPFRIALFAFNQLSEEFSHSLFCLVEGAAPRTRNSIYAPYALACSFLVRTEIAPRFQPMKNGIQRPWADFVSMTGQLFGHSRTKNQLLCGVMQNVEANHAGIEVAILTHNRISLSNYDITSLYVLRNGYSN